MASSSAVGMPTDAAAGATVDVDATAVDMAAGVAVGATAGVAVDAGMVAGRSSSPSLSLSPRSTSWNRLFLTSLGELLFISSIVASAIKILYFRIIIFINSPSSSVRRSSRRRRGETNC